MLLKGLQACLQEAGADLEQVDLFGADTGPGSFIGTRVAVTIAKTLAFARGKNCLKATAFDLVDPAFPVVLPNRRHEWFVRIPGEEVKLLRWDREKDSMLEQGFPEEFRGYGQWECGNTYPHACQFIHVTPQPIAPEFLLPEYLVEPSISTPKVPYAEAKPL